MGYNRYPGFPWKYSKTPLRKTHDMAMLGEDTEYVCKEVIGMSDAEYEDLKAREMVGSDHLSLGATDGPTTRVTPENTASSNRSGDTRPCSFIYRVEQMGLRGAAAGSSLFAVPTANPRPP